MNATAEAVNIQDYFVDLEKEKFQATTYSLVLENNTDFIVRRSTLKTERELVILISKGLYYIKDKKNESIDSVTLSSLKTFLRDLKNGLEMKQVHWMPMLCKDSADIIDRIISDDDYVEMCRHNVLSGIDDPQWYSGYWRKSKKLFIQLHAMFPTITDSQKYRPSFPIIFELNDKYGYNEAINFASKLVQSGIERFSAAGRIHYNSGVSHACDGFMNILENPQYNLQLRRFVDYALFDLYAQGIPNITDTLWHEYKDYLEMQMQFHGKVKEKYPASFKTEHDVITLKMNQVRAIQQCENFGERCREIEDLVYQYGEYCIIVPTQPEELAEEGVNLSHCIKSYIGRVSSGECHILFLRKSRNPEQSLVTLQLNNKCICQAQGLNRRAITKEEREFLLRWGAEKGINIDI